MDGLPRHLPRAKTRLATPPRRATVGSTHHSLPRPGERERGSSIRTSPLARTSRRLELQRSLAALLPKLLPGARMVGFSFIVVWAILAIVAGVIASNKNRSVVGWVLLSAFLTPLTMLVLIALKPIPAPESQYHTSLPPASTPIGRVDEKTCPMCAESVKREATICRFCRYEFTEADFQKLEPDESELAKARKARLAEIARFLLDLPQNLYPTLTPGAVAEIQGLMPDISIAIHAAKRRYELKRPSGTFFLLGDSALGCPPSAFVRQIGQVGEGRISGSS